MKIAISTTGRDLESQVDPRFGRASYFLIVDSSTKEVVEIIDNQAAQEVAHGAGINAATAVAQSGAEVVLTGRVGPKAFSVLSAAGIKVVSEVEGTAQKALKEFLSGDSPISDGPDGDGHFSAPKPGTARNCKCKGQGKRQGKGMGKGRCKQ